MPDRKKSIIIAIAAHKPYRMPEDPIYQPVFVGAALHPGAVEEMTALGYIPDNQGDNISDKNAGYSELTALYWAWKNLDADCIGLAHYRRHFATRKYHRPTTDPFDRILDGRQVQALMSKARIVVPIRQNYYIETLYSHYSHTHDQSHLDMAREIIAERDPDFLGAFDRAVGRTYGYMFNMLIADKELFDSYCSWLFGILGEMEERMDVSGMTAFEQRFYGRVSEILFNVWLERQKETGALSRKEIREVPYLYMEKIDWIKKISAFLKAKFLNKKYDGSF